MSSSVAFSNRLSTAHIITLLRPTLLFWIFALLHLSFWTVIPTLVSPNAPLDVIEGYVWGHEWLWGTYKHPPMQAWWLETLTMLTGQAIWTHFFASQLAILIAFWAIWQTGRRIVGEQSALISVVLLEAVAYYNFTSPEFNPNVLQLAFWPLIGLYFHKAIKEDHIVDWVLLGAFSACGLYSKYSTVLLLAALAVLMVSNAESRSRLASRGPYIAVLVTYLLLLPHLAWLIDNDFIPFNYIVSRMHDASQWNEYAMRLVRFPASQLLVLLPMMLLLFALTGKKVLRLFKIEWPLSFDQAFLFTVAFLPFMFLVLLTVSGLRVHDMWGTPLWGYAGLWAVNQLQLSPKLEELKRFAIGWAIIFVVTLSAYATTTVLYPYMTHASLRVYFPGHALAKQISAQWYSRYNSPLSYIIGDTWLAGNIAYYPPGRQHVLINGDYKISPWIKPTDVEKNGGILVWCIENCACHNKGELPPDYIKNFKEAQIQEPIVLRRQTDADIPPVKIGWAILPPKGMSTAQK